MKAIFRDIFAGLKDHRMNRTKLHSMENIVFISMAAVICGAETWDEIEEFGNERIDWLSTYLDMPNGVPSHDTFNRFFSGLDTDKFEDCFRKWVSGIIGDMNEDVIAIDGKTIRGSRGRKRNPLHVVSAWSTRNGMSLGQVAVNEKSSEITAIPELLDALFVKGAVVTIDALGCQTAIAKKIVEKEADYILAVKGNNKTLRQDVEETIDRLYIDSVTESFNDNHGRIEKRKYTVVEDTIMLRACENWTNIKSIIKVESEVTNKITGSIDSSIRYYITSLPGDSEVLGRAIRSHWGIENNLHWMLDVAFNEDHSQKKNRNAVMNFSLLNKIALTALKNDSSTKVGIKSKRKKAGWGSSYLERILGLK